MKLIVEGKDGRVLGSRDLEGSRWEQVENHFVNSQSISVNIETSGDFGDMYIKVGNGRVGSENTSALGRLEVGGAVCMVAHAMRLTWNEQHSDVWNKESGGNKLSFSLNAAGEVRRFADELSAILQKAPDDIPRLKRTALSLLASTDDLLASLHVAGDAK